MYHLGSVQFSLFSETHVAPVVWGLHLTQLMEKCIEAYDISTRNWQHSCIIAEKYSTMFSFFIPCHFHICIHGAQLSCTWDFYHDIFKKGECDLLYLLSCCFN